MSILRLLRRNGEKHFRRRLALDMYYWTDFALLARSNASLSRITVSRVCARASEMPLRIVLMVWVG